MERAQTQDRAGSLILVSSSHLDPTLPSAFQALGFEVHLAPSISAAVRLLSLHPPNPLILTDLALPDGNWRDLVEGIRKHRSSVPIILVSSAITAELWWDALECGIQDVLHAPLTPAALHKLLQANSAL